ncbi:hypothetical protein CHS0354_034235 [Potamilus streckersoni]|uniref:TGF-beta family profile domain-containing protein n=1 Tax=Potamilus streckersoni TaxID=2493646 RepID=A0AAE0SUE9_9BIVA|nr:hypothetical protein CHS0354_034235 [Potamilus streckersoni]
MAFIDRSCSSRDIIVRVMKYSTSYIIAPAGYDAYYCAGDCVYSPAANVTYHAVVQGLLNLRTPDKIPKPCCSPSKLSRYQVLYSTDNITVVLKNYKEMVVEACDCL